MTIYKNGMGMVLGKVTVMSNTNDINLREGLYYIMQCLMYIHVHDLQYKYQAFDRLVSGLTPQSTVLVMSRVSVNLTTIFLDKLRLNG